MVDARERIEIDMKKFDLSIGRLGSKQICAKEGRVVELAKMYASDSKAWLGKDDLFTSFSSISYAHGLLDAVLKIEGIIE